MIARLRGTAAGRTPDGLVVDVGGVGYLVAATPSVLSRAESGAEVTVETYLHVREDALQLYGFHDAAERELFTQLLTVSGIGPKVALAVVSGSPTADLRRAIALGDHARFQAIMPLRIEGQMRIGTHCFNAGDLAGAEAACERSAELASELGSFRDEARSITLLSLVRYYRGQVDEAERLALQALEWLERTGDTYLQLQNLRELARCALARSDLGLAEERLRKAVPLALERGGWLVIEIYRYLTETLVRQGRVEEARELVEFAARNLPPEDAYAQAALRLAEASVATADGEQAGAVARFDEALQLLREQRLLTDLGEARLAFARALRSFGEHVDARAELQRARDEFARMDAQELVAQIDRELAEAVTGTDGVGPRP